MYLTMLRKATVLVVFRDGEYLSRKKMLTGRIVWDQHLSNAWRTRDREKARRIAEKYGGTLRLFNPIIWRVRDL
jgi:hypothetical protein